MTIAGISPSPLSAKPLLDEARRLCPERSFHGAVCSMEGAITHEAARQSIHKDPTSESSIPASVRLSSDGLNPPSARLAFVYGTLKRGFGNHWLMEELMSGAHASFLGYACTRRCFPLICGPFQVPFLLASPTPSGHQVRGELYQVDSLAIARLDELEGVGKGHYERRPIDVQLIPPYVNAAAQTKHKGLEMGVPTGQNDVNPSNGDVDAELPGLDLTSCCTLTEPLSSCRLYMDPPAEDETETSPSLNQLSEYLCAEAYFACADYGHRMADCGPHIPCYTEKEASTYVRRKDRPHDRTFLEHVHAWIEEHGLILS